MYFREPFFCVRRHQFKKKLENREAKVMASTCRKTFGQVQATKFIKCSPNNSCLLKYHLRKMGNGVVVRMKHLWRLYHKMVVTIYIANDTQLIKVLTEYFWGLHHHRFLLLRENAWKLFFWLWKTLLTTNLTATLFTIYNDLLDCRTAWKKAIKMLRTLPHF